MGYLGSQATFTGTQNHKRISKTATQGQKDFTVDGGYDIGAIDVFRNGVRLVGQRDFSALDGVTVTLATGASADDILEFVTFVNFKVDDVVNKDGDSVIKGNVTISGDLGITGSLNATVSNTATSGFSTASGISTQVSGFLGVGVTGTNLNVTGVITANSFSGDGSGLTGIAATDDVSTNGLVVLGISTLAGATFSGVSTFSNNVILEANLDLQDNDQVLFGASDDMQIFHNGSDSYIDNATGDLYVRGLGDDLILRAADDITIQVSGDENAIVCTGDGAVELYYNNTKKVETDPDGVKFNDDFYVLDGNKGYFGTGNDLEIFHDGSNTYIKETGTGNVIHEVTDATIEFKKGGSEHLAKFIPDGAVELYYDNSKKLETTTGGINIGVGITMDGNGIAVSGILTCNGVAVGQNAIGARTIQSGGSPSGGSDGDIYYIY